MSSTPRLITGALRAIQSKIPHVWHLLVDLVRVRRVWADVGLACRQSGLVLGLRVGWVDDIAKAESDHNCLDGFHVSVRVEPDGTDEGFQKVRGHSHRRLDDLAGVAIDLGSETGGDCDSGQVAI